MSRRDPAVSLRQMRDHAHEDVELVRGRSRTDTIVRGDLAGPRGQRFRREGQTRDAGRDTGRALRPRGFLYGLCPDRGQVRLKPDTTYMFARVKANKSSACSASSALIVGFHRAFVFSWSRQKNGDDLSTVA